MRRATLLSTAALFLAAPAVAAPLAEAPPSTDAVATGEDIVVTAEKRSQTLINVPQSVTVVSGATLERQAATTFEDYLKLIPGLQIDQDTPGETRLILRGLNTGGVGSTVAVYQDETPFGSSTGQANGAILAGDFDTFDIARIEVLRGPQGTLYGASALGGVVKFVTNLPDTDPPRRPRPRRRRDDAGRRHFLLRQCDDQRAADEHARVPRIGQLPQGRRLDRFDRHRRLPRA